MSQKDEFHNLDDAADGLFRELAAGVTTRIFSGEQAMLSVGARVLDIFSPPRPEYKKAGSGFGTT
ncbi:hypothetical protein [Bradyrhizobium genosp. A]|uniref:hypothetical protein n=1 Tax=Bradyrhizobium genosp. A TaxID=83626 RepID=UPI003CED79CE